MRRLALIAFVVIAGVMVFNRSESQAQPAATVKIRVTSVQPDKQVEFAIRYLGAGLRLGGAIEVAKTPYDLTVPGDEVHALLRQTGGTGTMKAEVRSTSGSVAANIGPISLLVAAQSGVAVVGFDH